MHRWQIMLCAWLNGQTGKRMNLPTGANKKPGQLIFCFFLTVCLLEQADVSYDCAERIDTKILIRFFPVGYSMDRKGFTVCQLDTLQQQSSGTCIPGTGERQSNRLDERRGCGRYAEQLVNGRKWTLWQKKKKNSSCSCAWAVATNHQARFDADITVQWPLHPHIVWMLQHQSPRPVWHFLCAADTMSWTLLTEAAHMPWACMGQAKTSTCSENTRLSAMPKWRKTEKC